MPKTNKQLALEALELLARQPIALLRAAADVTPPGRRASSVLREAQRILARLPRMDDAVEQLYASADAEMARLAAGIIDTIPGRKHKPTWERVEWTTVQTPAGPVEGRVERRALEIRESRRAAPTIMYEWRVLEERPNVKCGWKTDAAASKDAAMQMFKTWAARRSKRQRR